MAVGRKQILIETLVFVTLTARRMHKLTFALLWYTWSTHIVLPFRLIELDRLLSSRKKKTIFLLMRHFSK